mmetsp:Transcript_63849/g.125713  ORF Transcript_63849/g.125713 Transcript_63849/m.125713 type:complete len:301 (-) Transcript_63849:262-1164(-)
MPSRTLGPQRMAATKAASRACSATTTLGARRARWTRRGKGCSAGPRTLQGMSIGGPAPRERVKRTTTTEVSQTTTIGGTMFKTTMRPTITCSRVLGAGTITTTQAASGPTLRWRRCRRRRAAPASAAAPDLGTRTPTRTFQFRTPVCSRRPRRHRPGGTRSTTAALPSKPPRPTLPPSPPRPWAGPPPRPCRLGRRGRGRRQALHRRANWLPGTCASPRSSRGARSPPSPRRRPKCPRRQRGQSAQKGHRNPRLRCHRRILGPIPAMRATASGHCPCRSRCRRHRPRPSLWQGLLPSQPR